MTSSFISLPNYVDKPPVNSLLVLFGESFRLGGQGTRDTGSQESYEPQINAALTHIKLIESLKEKMSI